jgi:oligopeptide transport system substrate-binding protein
MKRIIFFLFSFLILVSCEKKKEPIQRSELRLNIVQDQLTLDPRKGADFTSSTIQFLLFEGLTRMTPYSTVSLAIAENIELSDDMKKYTFTLRNAKWSNGDDITAFDFAETWKDMLSPSFPCPNAHLLYPIKNAEKAKRGEVSEREIGIHAVDHKTLEVYLEQPTPYFLEMISFCVFFPVDQSLVARNNKWADCSETEFVSNGAYRLVDWKIGNEIVLEKNPFYWDADNVDLDRIRISIVDNEMTALKMYEMNELDIIGLPYTGIPSDSVPSLMDKGVIKTTALPASTMCCFNMNSFPFKNANIRKAFAYAINRQEIVDNITQTGEQIGLHLVPDSLLPDQPDLFFKDGDEETARYFFKKGLRELGLTSNELGDVSLLHASTGVYPKVAQALQNQWNRVLGVSVQLKGYEYKVFLDKLTKRDYQMGQCVWIAQYQDPMNFFERFRHKDNLKNYPGYENPHYIKLLEDSLYLKNPSDRFALLNKAEEIFAEDMPLTPIYHWNTVYIQKPHVKNLQLYPSGSFYLNQIYFDFDDS